MRDQHYAANSQVMRDILAEIAMDSSLTRLQQRDHEFVLAELSRRMQARYGIQVAQFKLNPRDSTRITVDALGQESVCGSTLTTHFANTAFISKRKHYASWNVNAH
jgi:hypothetical protein